MGGREIGLRREIICGTNSKIGLSELLEI